MNREKRFEIIHKEGSAMSSDGYRQILIDRETGVHYLVWASGYAGSITPLLDADGKPIIRK